MMRTGKAGFWCIIWICLTLLATPSVPCFAQAGFDDDRVMLQGFYWESYRHGRPAQFPQFGSKKWYEIVKSKAREIRDARFDLVWLPPPSYAGDVSAGYNPKQYFNLNNSYGDFRQHRSMLVTLLQNGVEPVADVVINHRDGTNGWADFKNPDWGTWSITAQDEAFSNPRSEVFDTFMDKRGASEEKPEYAGHGGTTYGYPDFRDIDHSNETVRRDIIKYLFQLQSMGYRGWRYDMVHGYHAKYIALYNKATHPTFSVGEYDWGAHAAQRGWIYNTATVPGDLTTASSVFDFSTYFTLKDNKGSYTALYGLGNGIGMVGDNTDGIPWKNRAVTFLENHDTGYRTQPNGKPEEHHEHDSFENNWQVEQGYAQILTHPGVPCVYWKHYFDWGSGLREKIKALINARKAAGVHAGSKLSLQDNARSKGIYAAAVSGKNGDLYVRIGGSDAEWQPSHSNYSDYREYAAGNGWKVWVKLPGNPQVKQAALRRPLPIPKYREPLKIKVPESAVK